MVRLLRKERAISIGNNTAIVAFLVNSSINDINRVVQVFVICKCSCSFDVMLAYSLVGRELIFSDTSNCVHCSFLDRC